MQSLKRRRDPAPSRFEFRMRRLWRSAGFRRAATVWAPLALVLGGVVWVASQPHLRVVAAAQIEMAKAAVSERPEFSIQRFRVSGASPSLEREIIARLEAHRGASALETDVDAIRREIMDIGWVASARARFSAPETLVVSLVERTPVAIWRRGESLTLVDDDGYEIAGIDARGERLDLPLIAGAGADREVAEARAILEAAGDIANRIRGLVRVGERRWNLVLHEGPKIMLPATDVLDAMGYLVALEAGESVLARDISTIDLRVSTRPTLRLNPDAADALKAGRELKTASPGEDA